MSAMGRLLTVRQGWNAILWLRTIEVPARRISAAIIATRAQCYRDPSRAGGYGLAPRERPPRAPARRRDHHRPSVRRGV